MNTEYIINEIKPLDFCIEKDRVTLILKDNVTVFLHDIDDGILFNYFIDKKIVEVGITDQYSLAERLNNINNT